MTTRSMRPVRAGLQSTPAYVAGYSYKKLATVEEAEDGDQPLFRRKEVRLRKRRIVRIGRLRLRKVTRVRLKWLSPLSLLKAIIAIYASLLVQNKMIGKPQSPYLVMGFPWSHPPAQSL